MSLSSAASFSFTALSQDGDESPRDRLIAEEMPVAIEVNGIGYAVLMATPADLLDLAIGFALGERLIDRVADVIDVEAHDVDLGRMVRLTIAPALAGRVFDRIRHRTSDSSCGLCGVENLAQALRPLPPVSTRWAGEDIAVFAALAALAPAQPLGAQTRSVHGAAACTIDGAIRLVREDVGRHNAFDKLIGAMVREGLAWDGGFALLTSRCSYELVEKAVLAGCPMLATISAPTALALRRADRAGLALRVLARPDALLKPVPRLAARGSMKILGAVLAGGASSRFGSDKARARLDDRPLIAHVLDRLSPQCDELVVCGRDWPGAISIPDLPRAGLGPLGGLCAALHRGAARQFDAVVTAPCDVPDLPHDIAARLVATGVPAVVASLPVIGLWPCHVAQMLDHHLATSDDRSLRCLVRLSGARELALDTPLTNVNRPGDLAEVSLSRQPAAFAARS